MHYADRQVLPADNPRQVHQTGHIACGDNLCAIGDMVPDAVLAHFYRYAGFCNREGAPEATAFVLAVQGYQVNAADGLQEFLDIVPLFSPELRGLSEPKPAQAMAALMDTNPVREIICREIADAEHIQQEFT